MGIEKDNDHRNSLERFIIAINSKTIEELDEMIAYHQKSIEATYERFKVINMLLEQVQREPNRPVTIIQM